MSFSEDVKSIRQRSLMSQEAFAQAIGVSFTTVNRWETGKCRPSYKTIKQLSDFCKENNITIDIAKNFINEGGKDE